MVSQSTTSASKPLAIVTGASVGIGAAIAKKLSEMGHPLLLISRRKELMKAFNLPNTLAVSVDVTNPVEMKEAVRQAEELYGPADLIVNNAGVMFLGALSEQSTGDIGTMVNINVNGVINGTKAVIAGMLERKSGTIINVGSIAGIKPFTNHVAYCTTKYAVQGFSEALQAEVSGSNVRVTALNPGVVQTELLETSNDTTTISGYRKWVSDNLHKVLDPEDIAESVKFIYNLPQHACVRELVIGPTTQLQ
eukprot:Nk52_evm2s1485 gene=Nk52_evmTU2s1485